MRVVGRACICVEELSRGGGLGLGIGVSVAVGDWGQGQGLRGARGWLLSDSVVKGES